MTTNATLALDQAAPALAAIGRRFYARGWVLGTSGNFSAVVSRDPLRLAITASSLHKGELDGEHILEVDERGDVTHGRRKPSAETLLHVEIARRMGAGAILHTHSVWSTLLSDRHERDGGFEITGFEMLKGLRGIGSHEDREWIPILPNDQDMTRLSRALRATLDVHPECHAVILCRHGLYTWGESLADAERHVEILEFLFEVIGRQGVEPRTEPGRRVRRVRRVRRGPGRKKGR
jgi:methylthioribulose-1-phosphate dehydratase